LAAVKPGHDSCKSRMTRALHRTAIPARSFAVERALCRSGSAILLIQRLCHPSLEPRLICLGSFL
jgi:hypothetical protein